VNRAACEITDRVRHYSHERLLQRLETEGTRRCRSRDATQRGRKDLLRGTRPLSCLTSSTKGLCGSSLRTTTPLPLSNTVRSGKGGGALRCRSRLCLERFANSDGVEKKIDGCLRAKRRSKKCFQRAPKESLDPKKLVFVDESGTNITLLHRCTGGHPKERGPMARLQGTGRRTSRSLPPSLLKESEWL
jgi:hypothetical protein